MFTNITQFVPSHVCLACDGCCRFKEEDSSWRPKVAEDEGLAGYIFAKEALDDKHQIKAMRCKDGTYQCRFFSLEGNSCTIYAYRPLECRLYPFIIRQRGQDVLMAVHLNCPYIEQMRPREEFVQYVNYLKIFFAQPEVTAFISKNRGLIDTYVAYEEELEDLFKIGL